MPSPQSYGSSELPSSSPFTAFANLIRLFNQTGTLLLLFPTLWSLFLASEGWPNPKILFIFVLGSFVMRSAGVIMNDLADQSFDRQVKRTQHRPLASGHLTRTQATVFLVVWLVIAASLLGFLNYLTLLLSPIALLLAGLYPFSKRVIHIPQLILGLAFGWGGIMAWAAVRNELDLSAWLLFAATVCWAVAYDTVYAIQDMEDDRKVGIKSSAIYFGSFTWLGVGLASSGMLFFLSLVGQKSHLGIEFYGALCAVAILLAIQVARIRLTISPEQAFALFKQHCWIGALILLGISLGVH